MTLPASHERERRRPSRGRAVRRALARVVLAALLLAAGVALGEALHDRPQPGGTRTLTRQLRPLPLAPARETVTVTTTVTGG